MGKYDVSPSIGIIKSFRIVNRKQNRYSIDPSDVVTMKSRRTVFEDNAVGDVGSVFVLLAKCKVFPDPIQIDVLAEME